jgi:hypothetical protein
MRKDVQEKIEKIIGEDFTISNVNLAKKVGCSANMIQIYLSQLGYFRVSMLCKKDNNIDLSRFIEDLPVNEKRQDVIITEIKIKKCTLFMLFSRLFSRLKKNK